jgi:hypothetical protein
MKRLIWMTKRPLDMSIMQIMMEMGMGVDMDPTC